MPPRYFSTYLTMRDGVRIALDIWLPAGARTACPTIVRQTSYFRSIQLRWPLSLATGGRPFDPSGIYTRRRKLFLAAGYAWVDVDVRGSGASSGFRIGPWSQPEVADAREILDWIVAQPWCNGRLGALGVSYDGTAAEMLLTTGHNAVKAIAPRFSCHDAYRDIGFPGGIPNSGFTQLWGKLNHALEQNRLQDVVGPWVLALSSGVTAVQGDRHGQQRAAAVREHATNYDVLERMQQILFADDDPPDVGPPNPPVFADDGTALRGAQLVSPAYYVRAIRESGAAIFNISGWWDGGYARAAAVRFQSLPNPGSRLLLGPWNHGGGSELEQADQPHRSTFDHDQKLLQFFDLHLQGIQNALANEPPVRYFTMIESRWKSANCWPPPGFAPVDYFLNADHRLDRQQPEQRQVVSYRQQLLGSGKHGRWRTQAQLGVPVRYADRRSLTHRLLSFATAPLARDSELTGHGVIDLYLASTIADPVVLVYLEDVSPTGQVFMVSEGGLRARHRRVKPNTIFAALGIPYQSFLRTDDALLRPISSGEANDADFVRLQFDMLPVSYLFCQGHCLQISLALADVDNFPAGERGEIFLSCGGERPSRVQLPFAAT